MSGYEVLKDGGGAWVLWLWVNDQVMYSTRFPKLIHALDFIQTLGIGLKQEHILIRR